MDIPILVDGLASLVDQYDVFLLDQFGVLHDGVQPLDGASECVNMIKAKSKMSIILSNSSRRSEQARMSYQRIGLPEHYSAFLTSGEVAWQYLNKHFRGKKCVWITWVGHSKDDYLESLDITPSCVEEADFVFFHGSQVIVNAPLPTENLVGEQSYKKLQEDAILDVYNNGKLDESLLQLLKSAAARGLPGVCANDDFTVVRNNICSFMPGTIKAAYEELGGVVTSFGKPAPAVFAMAQEEAYRSYYASHAMPDEGSRSPTRGVSVPDPLACLDSRQTKASSGGTKSKNKILKFVHVGDSVHHDIAGNATNIAFIPVRENAAQLIVLLPRLSVWDAFRLKSILLVTF